MTRTLGLFSLFFLGAGAIACSNSGAGDPGAAALDGGDEGGTIDGSGFDPDTSLGEKKIVGLAIDQLDKSLEIVNGDLTGGSISYTATATFDDGSTAAEPGCTWQVDRIDLGSFVGSTFKATGNAGGTGKVTCSAKGLTATTSVKVTLRDEVDASSGLDDTSKKDLLAAVTSDPDVKLLYPYDKTVFPRGLDAPELQWTGKSAADVYGARLKVDGMTFTAFFKAPPPSRALIPKATWTKLLDTATPTTPVEMTLYRLAGGAGGTAFKVATQTWTIAAANLKGSIYYWRINGGNVVRIKPGDPKPENFLKTEPTPGRCVACHSVSHDGSTLVGSYENGGPYPWAAFDVKSGVQKATGANSGFQAITPEGSMLLTGQTAGTFALVSTSGTSFEPSGAAAFGNAVAHASFAPDSKWIAYANRKDGNWVDFNQSDLMLASFDAATKKFGAPKTLMASGGRVKTYPTFSPDSKWVGYMDATQSTRPGKGDLHMMKLDGSGDVTLANACAAGIADVDKSLNFEPTFGPVLSGGYFWMVFVSSRQYGNRINKTFDAFRDKCGDDWTKSPCRTKQLWVTAIDADPKPGVDPSHPAFWLPGQDVNDQNMRGYWALDPCKGLGEGCEAGFECCEGACKSEDGKSAKVCVKPPPGTCKSVGDKCEATSDCCEASVGVECIGGVCGKKLPS